MEERSFFTGSICLTDIPKELITTASNGKKYLNIAVFANRDGANQFGNTHFITCAPKKEDRVEGKKYIIGNLKERYSNATLPQTANISVLKGDTGKTEQSNIEDDFPF